MDNLKNSLIYRYGKVRNAISNECGFQISFLPKQKALWYRVPKAGTRSLNKLFKHQVEGYFYGGLDVLLDPFCQDWFKFTIIREPVERTRSLWRQKILGGLGPELWGITESENEKLKDFDEFVRWLGDQNLDSGEVHFRKQSALVPVEQMDYIGTLENLDEDLFNIYSKLNLDYVKPPHQNKTNRPKTELALHTRELIWSYYREDRVLWEYYRKKGKGRRK